jgi:hypothetical protein
VSVAADIIEHIAEVARRRLYVTSACTSLFAYCHEVIGYAQDVARHYVTVAYVVLEHPVVLEMLRAGTLNVSGVRVIAPALDCADADARLAAAAGKTRDELERLVASWQPKPLAATRVTAVTFDNKQERLGLGGERAGGNRSTARSTKGRSPTASPRSHAQASHCRALQTAAHHRRRDLRRPHAPA